MILIASSHPPFCRVLLIAAPALPWVAFSLSTVLSCFRLKPALFTTWTRRCTYLRTISLTICPLRTPISLGKSLSASHEGRSNTADSSGTCSPFAVALSDLTDFQVGSFSAVIVDSNTRLGGTYALLLATFEFHLIDGEGCAVQSKIWRTYCKERSSASSWPCAPVVGQAEPVLAESYMRQRRSAWPMRGAHRFDH